MLYNLKDVEVTHTTNDFYELMKQIRLHINDTIEDVVKKSALNTDKKYIVYWSEINDSHKMYTHFKLYDNDEDLHDGALIDLDKVREYLKTDKNMILNKH